LRVGLGGKVNIGSVLVGGALILVVVAYLARPFRIARVEDDLDQVIETWVAQARVGELETEGLGGAEGVVTALSVEKEDRIAYCHQCGRSVGPEDRFCARCGTLLRESAG
jgi:hypothetical protein